MLLANFLQKNNNTFGIYNKIVVIKVYKLYRLAVLIVSKKARIFYADAEAVYPLGLSCRHHQEGYQKYIWQQEHHHVRTRNSVIFFMEI